MESSHLRSGSRDTCIKVDPARTRRPEDWSHVSRLNEGLKRHNREDRSAKLSLLLHQFLGGEDDWE